MVAHAELHRGQSARKQSVEAINRAMARFPMIVGILEILEQARVPFPGDDDIRHGCERAVTAMLVELARITPAPPGKTSEYEETALNWLQGKSVERLVNADQLQRIQQFIERILCTPLQHH